MDFADLRHLSEPPREHIPDEWAHKGYCPVCHAAQTLGIRHFDDAPDQFVCEQCDAAFEVQSAGSKIRLMTLPETLRPAWMEVINRWMEPADVQKLYRRYLAAGRGLPAPEEQEGAEDDVPVPKMTNREAMFYAMELQRLGNDYKTIEMLLLQSGASQRQAVGAVRKLKQQAQKKARQRSCLITAMGTVTLVILAALAGFLWFTSRESGAETGTVTNLFPQLNPGEVVTELMNVPTPQVIYRGPAASRCPATNAQAAELFGGEASWWSAQRGLGSNAWIMTQTGSPVTIRVPENMYAGYMKLDSMQMISVDGPATIRNVNFIVITCD